MKINKAQFHSEKANNIRDPAVKYEVRDVYLIYILFPKIRSSQYALKATLGVTYTCTKKKYGRKRDRGK